MSNPLSPFQTFRETYGSQIEETKAVVAERLAALPASAAGIAEVLLAEGITARCGDAYKCAIAEYVRPVLPEGWGAAVCGTSLDVGPVATQRPNSLLLNEVIYDVEIALTNDDQWGEYEDDFDVQIDSLNALQALKNPPAVTSFIRDFDSHAYPALEA